MRELVLIFLGLCVGLLMGGWAFWHIISYIRADSRQRYRKRFYFRIALFVALIALADLGKVARDVLLFMSS